MDVQEFVKLIGDKYYESVEALLKEMLVGEILCVHKAGYPKFSIDDNTLRIEQVMHTMDPIQVCAMEYNIELQYGPKTEEMQKEIECAFAGGAPWGNADKAPSTTSATVVEAATASASPHSDCKCSCYIGCGTGPWQFCKDHGDRYRS
jgi:hypothetical protein